MALSSIQLEAFFVLAQSGQFTIAGKRLGITQSALSQRISNLEEELGTTLLIRNRTGPQLTESGLELLRYCQAKEGLESEVMSRVKTTSKQDIGGVLRIAGFSTVMDSVVLPAIAPLLKKHPRVQLVYQTAELAELPELLKMGKVDFLITDEESKQHGIQSHLLGEERNVLVEKKDGNIPDVYLDHDENDQTTFRYCKIAKIKGKIERHYLDGISGIIAATNLGLGKAVLPIHLLKGSHDLKVLFPKISLNTPVYLQYYQQSYYSRLHQLTVETLLDNTSKHLGRS